ncbi:MAG: hypothetical protein MMC33_004192 [Icmadophila ericetorum]|nr:hypothetical protein [Icmadophila ericetorum]
MSQNFNNYNGFPPQNPANSDFGELTNSLIFPPPLNFQQPFTPWTNAPGWQADGQNNYNAGNMGNFYQNQMATPGYLNDQQDYVPFDDGEDFYPAEATPVVQGSHGTTQQNGISRQNMSAIANNPPSNPPSNQASISGVAAPIVKAGEKQQPRDNTSLQKHQNEAQKEAEGRLEFLRAKLLAGKASGGKTPTPEPKAAAKPVGGTEGQTSSTVRIGNENMAPTDTIKRNSIVQQPSTTKGSTSTNLPIDTKPIASLKTSLNSQAASPTDIDALFSEARAAEAAKKSKPAMPALPQRRDPISQKESFKSSPKPVSITLPIQETPLRASSSRRPSVTNPSPTEVSEQGEIREDNIKKEQHSLKPSLAQDKPKDLKEQGKHMVSTTAVSNTKAQPISKQPEKIDTTMANVRRESGIDSAKTKSPTSARILPVSRPRDVNDPPAPTDTREDNRRGRNFEPTYDRLEAERDRSRERYPYRESFRPERESFRPAKKRYSLEQAEKDAAEYKRNLRLSGARLPEDAPAPATRLTEKLPPTPKAEVVDQKSDVQEWLEMTGYFDEAYRKKALFNHRSLSALDRQRAELERQIQLDHEERLQISRNRSLSIRPRDSEESPTTRSTMAPPPIPTKETKDEVGIQIKDLANRDTLAAAKRAEDDSHALKPDSASTTNLAPPTKRQQPEDGFESPTTNRPIEKLARTNSREYSKAPTSPPARAPLPLESRSSVDNGTYKREYLARSRSPRRSPSPSYRRASGPAEMHSGASSRTGYSPLRRPDLSRDPSPFNRRDSGLSYDEERETSGPRGRYQSYRHDNDNSSYTPPYANGRGGSFYSSYRGRGNRGRGYNKSAYFNMPRGGKPYDREGSE